MDFQIYNTLTRNKELFTPIDPKLVSVYSCGPTVYSDPHVGNLRYFAFCGLLGDVLRHVCGYNVKHVMNITDVGHLTDDGDHGEDKMEKGARREWLSARDIAKKYEENFKKYLTELHISFDQHPKATDYIPEQIAIVQTLVDKWLTYIIDGDGIYMNTAKIDDYGKLMWPNYKKHLEWLSSGERVDDAGKQNPTDFALWKFSPVGEQRQMERESPRGKGFPGWHIECSAMSQATLGDHFDIHTGGVDHISIHHTNEIAQSECSFAHKHKWVNYWMHSQFLNIDGKKVSKSAGDDLSLPWLEKKWFDALDLRYFFLSAHYRSFQDFTREHLEAAKSTRKNLKQKIQSLIKDKKWSMGSSLLTLSAELLSEQLLDPFVKELHQKLITEYIDDLNSPNALAHIHYHLWVASKDILNFDIEELFVVLERWEHNVLKLGLFEEAEELVIPAEITALAQERVEAKKNKDYKLADMIRENLAQQWWYIEDTPNGFNITR